MALEADLVHTQIVSHYSAAVKFEDVVFRELANLGKRRCVVAGGFSVGHGQVVAGAATESIPGIVHILGVTSISEGGKGVAIMTGSTAAFAISCSCLIVIVEFAQAFGVGYCVVAEDIRVRFSLVAVDAQHLAGSVSVVAGGAGIPGTGVDVVAFDHDVRIAGFKINKVAENGSAEVGVNHGPAVTAGAIVIKSSADNFTFCIFKLDLHIGAGSSVDHVRCRVGIRQCVLKQCTTVVGFFKIGHVKVNHVASSTEVEFSRKSNG
mgnify:CR=1 FL=1